MKSFFWALSCAGLAIGFSGCASLSPVNSAPQQLQQAMPNTDQQQLALLFNTAKDDTPQVWHSADGSTLYQLTTSNTHVNAQGLPCRTYLLMVKREYHRQQTTTAMVCRNNSGQWQVSDSD